MRELKNSRIETLDWLRGLMALSIMFYHLTIWIIYPLDSSNTLGRLGIYGVSIFFVLSGLSMAVVYNVYINSIKTSINFYVRRIFRIWPLLWIVCILAIIPQIVRVGTYDWNHLFLNVTTLFGFIKPSASIAVGAWSIGNEMVYYALTPLIFYLYNYKKWVGNVFFLASLSVGMVFAFNLLTPNMTLSEQWELYVNPFNNLYLYVMGIAIYYNFRDININSMLNIALLILAVSLFCALPFEGNQISIVSGSGRVIFTVLSFIIVLCFYKLRIQLPDILGNTLETFGIATYGVYLIHPIVYLYAKFFLKEVNMNSGVLLFSIVAVLTIVMSIFSYKLFELRLVKIGKQVTSASVNMRSYFSR